MGHHELFEAAIFQHLDMVRQLLNQQQRLVAIAETMGAALQRGNKILWCGNGGSAACSQHLAAEIVGRFCRARRGLPSIAMSSDSSILTAIANDYGYPSVFFSPG